jgi:4-amino-4-deoxy-L-arabinose transferase-like glycosyltransferase
MIGLLLLTLGVIIYSRLFISPNNLQSMQELYVKTDGWSHWKKSLPWVIVNLGIYALVMTQLARHQYSNTLFWGWLATLLIFTILFWKNEHKPDTAISRADILWMLILFSFAIAAGSYLLNDLPAGWIADEGPFWKTARGIALGEIKPSIFDVGVFTFPVASSYLQAWIMRWAGVNLWGWRFASVLPAAATVVPLYLLARELFDRRAAIAASVMMIVNPYFLTFARLGYNNSQSLFPVTLCIYFLVLGFRKNNRYYLWLAGLTAGLGFYTYFSAWLGLVVILMVIMILPLISREKFRKSLIPFIIIIAGTLAVLLPRVLYGMSGDSAISLHYKIWETGPINTFYGKLVFGDERIAQTHVFMMDEVEVFYDLPLYGILLLRGLVRSSAVLFDPIGYNDHQIIFGLAGVGSSLFFILGLGVTLANFRKFRYLIPSIWFLAGFIFLGVLASIPPRPTHMVTMIPALSFISAIGLVSFLDAITNTDPDRLERSRRIKNFAVIGILAMIAMMGLFQFFFMIPYAYSPPNQDDYISWLGRQIPAPANIYLIDHYSTTRNPMDESLLKLTQHKVVTLTLADLEADPNQVKTWKNFAAFISPQNGREYAERLAGQIPGSSVHASYVTGQRLRGYVVTDLQINTSMDISFSHGIKDLWNSPTRVILLLCGAGVILLFLKQWTAKGQTSNKMSETP